jgi:hypothetical protein
MTQEDFKLIIAIAALLISCFAYFNSLTAAKRNVRLSIQQALFKTVSDKAKDCNSVWGNEPANERNDTSPHYLVMTELIISKEVIDRAFKLFALNQPSIKRMKDDYFYLLYKQLTPDVRGYLQRSKKLVDLHNNEYFTDQVREVLSVLERYFEKKK